MALQLTRPSTAWDTILREAPRAETQAARVVNLANWSDANRTSLAPHEPEPTGAIIELGSKH
jgi:hypothetical protein